MSQSEGPRNFGVFLQSLEDGQVLVDLSTELHRLNDAIARQSEQTGSAKGELTLKLKIVCTEFSKVTVEADIASKPPKAKRGKSWLWFTRGNNLTNENPKQPTLFPREVTAPVQPTAARDAAPKTSDETRGA